MTGVLINEGTLDPQTYTQREDGVKTQGEDSYPQVEEGGRPGVASPSQPVGGTNPINAATLDS